MPYTPGEGVFEPSKKDPFASFFQNLIGIPRNLLNMLQMTPQVNQQAVDIPGVTGAEGDQLINDINNLGLIDQGIFTSADLDEAFHQNANGNAAPLRAIIDRVNSEKNYSKNFSGLEKTYNDIVGGADWADLVASLKEDIEKPIYSKNDIESAVAGNTSNVLSTRDRNLEAGREALAGRGILNSGISVDLVTEARQTADELIRKGEIEIPTTLEKENKAVKAQAQSSLSSLLGQKANLETQLGSYLADVRQGMKPYISSSDLARTLQEQLTGRESVRLSNAMLTKQSLGETKQDIQNAFEDIMSIVGMMKGSKGGGGSKSGGGGGFSILGTGGSVNKSCIDINAIVIIPTGAKRIGDVKEGDKVLTPYGFKTVEFIDIGFVPEKQREKCIKIITNKRPLICTVSHPVLVNGEFKRADKVKSGDFLQSFKKNYKVIRVVPIKFVDGCDLVIDGADSYFVNGIEVQSTFKGQHVNTRWNDGFNANTSKTLK